MSTKRWILIAAVLGSGIVFLDSTVVNVALPKIGRDLPRLFLGVLEGQSYVYNAYLLTLSALLILAGAVNDFYGRKRTFLLGLVGFGATSVLCGFAPNMELLVLFRVLQGATGALLVPGSLALITANFSGEEQGRAFGTWAGASVVDDARQASVDPARPLSLPQLHGHQHLDPADLRGALRHVLLPRPLPAGHAWLHGRGRGRRRDTGLHIPHLLLAAIRKPRREIRPSSIHGRRAGHHGPRRAVVRARALVEHALEAGAEQSEHLLAAPLVLHRLSARHHHLWDRHHDPCR